MFETTDDEELPIPEALAPFGRRAWDTVLLRLHLPWFFVNCGLKYACGPQLQEIRLLSTPDKLCELKKSTILKIFEVYLVSPAIFNGTNHWRMDQLVQIWQADEPDEQTVPVHIFVVADGKRYVNSVFDTREERLQNPRLLFDSHVMTEKESM